MIYTVDIFVMSLYVPAIVGTFIYLYKFDKAYWEEKERERNKGRS